MKKTFSIYADLETTTTDKPQIYSWNALYDKDNRKLVFEHNKTYNDEIIFHYGIDGKSFLDFIEKINFDAIIYFNNSKSFDAHFIVPLLDAAGYENILPYDFNLENDEISEYMKDRKKNRVNRILDQLLMSKQIKKEYEKLKETDKKAAAEFISKKIKRRWNKVLPYEYKLMTTKNSQIYQIKIGIDTYKRTNGEYKNRAILINDSLLLFPISIKKMGETLIEHHKKLLPHKDPNIWVEKFSKQKIDYKRTELYKSIEEFKNDKNEFNYILQDTFILYKFHKLIEEVLPRKEWKLTIGSTTYGNWKKWYGEKILEMMVQQGKAEIFEKSRGYKMVRMDDKNFTLSTARNSLINITLPSKWLDALHPSYEVKNYKVLEEWVDGGITKINEEIRGEPLENITIVDIHSSYPAAMCSDTMVPIGIPEIGNKKEYPFKFYTLTVKNKIVNKKGLPFLYNKLADKREWKRELKQGEIYKFTSITLPFFLKYYNPKKSDYSLKIEYSFMQAPINKFFKGYVEKWYKTKNDAKKNKNKVLEFIAKIILNANFGKFITHSTRESKVWDQHRKRWIDHIEEIESKYYLPMGAVITEIGRMNLVKAVDDRYNDDFCYCDTDSIFARNFDEKNYKHLKITADELGTWGYELKNGYGIFRRPKQYLVKSAKPDGLKKMKISYSGINFDSYFLGDEEIDELACERNELRNVTFTDMVIGKKIDKQLIPERIYGYGILLLEQVKNINPVWSVEKTGEFTKNKKEKIINYYPILSEQKKYEKQHFIKDIEKALIFDRMEIWRKK